MALTTAQIDAAITEILEGGQRVMLNGSTYERANLDSLWKLRKAVQQEERETAASGTVGGGGLTLANLQGARR